MEAADFRYVLFPNLPPALDGQSNDPESLRSMQKMNTDSKWMRAFYRIKDGANYDKTKSRVADNDDESAPDDFQLGKRGVVDDCCYKPCTLQYLLKNYCG